MGLSLSHPHSKVSRLSNGVQVASLETHSYSSSLSLYVRAGSRFETYHQQGVAHVLKRAAFLVSWLKQHTASTQGSLKRGHQTTPSTFVYLQTPEIRISHWYIRSVVQYNIIAYYLLVCHDGGVVYRLQVAEVRSE